MNFSRNYLINLFLAEISLESIENWKIIVYRSLMEEAKKLVKILISLTFNLAFRESILSLTNFLLRFLFAKSPARWRLTLEHLISPSHLYCFVDSGHK